MSREQLLALSRRLSECEDQARTLRNHQGITDAIHGAQLAIARQLGRIDEPFAPPEPDPPPLSGTVRGKLRAHLETAGHGGQSRLARKTGIAPSTLSKFARTGELGRPQLKLLAAALDKAEAEGRPS